MCLVFDTVPSRLAVIYWAYTREDLVCKLNLFMDKEVTTAVVNFTNLAQIASAIFGSEKEEVKPVQNVEEAFKAFHNLMALSRGG